MKSIKHLIIFVIYFCTVQNSNGITIVGKQNEINKLKVYCVSNNESETLSWATPYDESFYKHKSESARDISKFLPSKWKIGHSFKTQLGPVLDPRWQNFETFVSKNKKKVDKRLKESLDGSFEIAFSLKFTDDAEMSFHYNNQLKQRISFNNDLLTSIICPYDKSDNCNNFIMQEMNLKNVEYYNFNSWNHFTIRYSKNNNDYILLMNGLTIQNEEISYFAISNLEMESSKGAMWKLHSYELFTTESSGNNIMFLNNVPAFKKKLCMSGYFYFLNELTIQVRLDSRIIKNATYTNDKIGWKFIKIEEHVQRAAKKRFTFWLNNNQQSEVIFSDIRVHLDCDTDVNKIYTAFDVSQIKQVSCESLNNPGVSIRMGENSGATGNVCPADKFGNDCIKCQSVFYADFCDETLVCVETDKCYCQPGYHGKYCQSKCDNLNNKVFGSNCGEKCGNCKNDDPCHHITGHCPSGCKQPFLEPFCKPDCKDLESGDVNLTIVNGKIAFYSKKNDGDSCKYKDYTIKSFNDKYERVNDFNPNSNYVIEFWRDDNFVFNYSITSDQEKPGAISEAKAESNVTSVYLSWMAPDESVGNIVNYSITYKLQPTEDCEESLKHLIDPQTVYVQKKSVEINNLRPHSTYVFEVQGFNKHPGEVKRIVQKTSSRDVPNPDSYVINNVSLTHDTMSIDLKKNCEQIESDVAFRLNLQCFDSWCTNLTKTFVSNEKVLFVEDLKAFTNYTIIIEMAVDENFENTVSMQPKLVKTKPSVSNELRDMDVYSISNSGISLVFDLPHPPTGILEEIQMNNAKIAWEKCSIWKNRFCSTLVGTKCSNSTMKVDLKNINVTSIKTYNVEILCQEKEPDPPQNLQQHWDEDSNLVLSWEHPLHMNGEFDKFIISYANKDEDFITQENLTYNHKISEDEICSSKDRNPILKVATKNKLHEAKSAEIQIKCPVARPELPTEYVNSTEIGMDDINIFVIISSNYL